MPAAQGGCGQPEIGGASVDQLGNCGHVIYFSLAGKVAFWECCALRSSAAGNTERDINQHDKKREPAVYEKLRGRVF